MNINEFDFTLPQELIAQKPVSKRDQSKLLVYKDSKISDSNFNSIVDFLQEEDVLVFNDVKVIKAKLCGKIAKSGSNIEFNLDQEIFDEPKKDKIKWRAICKGARKIKEKDIVEFSEEFSAIVAKKLEDGFCLLEFDAQNFMENLAKHGRIPLPPYIKREENPTKQDEENYQTIYAKQGSGVAAPTAGLHFSDEIFTKLDAKKIKRVFVTLNVGAGTFLPVRVDDIKDHKMHEEFFTIDENAANIINEAKSCGKRIIAVGTTSLRVLESVADENGIVKAQSRNTKIFIYPGYKFKVIDGLITNFHLPKSTLFMLVCAAIGKENARKVYAHAIAQKYRFFSYGDSSFLLL